MNNQLTVEEYEQLNPAVKVDLGDTHAYYFTPNSLILWRVHSLFEKEPETIDWIKTFSPGDVMVDVGANVGMYTILAAVTRRVRVFAFEPEAQNFAILNRNIVLNELSQQVTAYCVALSNTCRFDNLYLSTSTPGDACHSFGEKVDFQLRPKQTPYVQGCYSTTLDKLIAQGAIPPPNHIKIDVDGFEHKVIEGAASVLKRPELRSILVEINTNLTEHTAIIEIMTKLGFVYSQRSVEDSMVKEGHFAGTANFVFERKTPIHVLKPHISLAPANSTVNRSPLTSRPLDH